MHSSQSWLATWRQNQCKLWTLFGYLSQDFIIAYVSDFQFLCYCKKFELLFFLKKFKTNFLNCAKQMTNIGSGTSDAWCKRRRQFELHFRCCQPKPQTVQSTTDRNKNLAPGYCNRTNTTALKNQNKFIIMIIVSHWQIFTPQKMADGYLHTSLRKNTIKNVMSWGMEN